MRIQKQGTLHNYIANCDVIPYEIINGLVAVESLVRRLAIENPSLFNNFIGIILRNIKFKDQSSKPLVSELLTVLPIIVVADIQTGRELMKMLPQKHSYTILPLAAFRTDRLPEMKLARNRVSNFFFG